MLSLSVALDPNNGIGLNGKMPWHLKGELKIFKQNTLYKHVLMGNTTYENLPNKLVDRYMIVVCNEEGYTAEDCEVCSDLIQFCKDHQDDEEEYVICGGATIYRLAYPYVKKAYVSFVKQAYEVDTWFTNFSLEDWEITKEVDYPEYIYRELIRK